MATVKDYTLNGYVNNALCLSTQLRINSHKLAEKRFRTKYSAVLVGSWRIDVLLDKKQVHSFMLNQLDLFQQKGSKTVPVKEQNSSLNGVNPKIKAGKLAMQVLERNYSDGAIPTMTGARGQVFQVVYLMGRNAWHGKGRRPRWLCDYESKGGKLADIKIEISE